MAIAMEEGELREYLAAAHNDLGPRQAVGEAMTAKYAGLGPPAAVPGATRGHDGDDAVIRFVATERVGSWDNARLRLAPIEQGTARRG